MSKSGPKSLSELLCDADSPIRRLADEAQSRVELADRVRAGLPAPLNRHIEACNLRDDGTLVVTTTSPEWAARLRFEGDSILSRCRQQHPGAARVKIRVQS